MRRLLLVFLLAVQVYAASLMVPAVTHDGAGMTALLICEVNPGKGRVLVATEPLVGVDTQQSENIATRVASEVTGVSLSDKDIIFIFEANQTESIDGGSAGAAMAICLISELSGKELNSKVSITGTIEEDGTIGPVGGILSKARAVSESSAVFLVPDGQTLTSTYSKRYESPRPGIYIDEIYPIKINITEYSRDNLGLQVVEISDISDAESWFFSEKVFTKEIRTIELPTFAKDLSRVEALADYELSRAEKSVNNVNSTVSQELLQNAINSPEGSPYTTANFAFLAYVSSTPTFEDVESIATELTKQFAKIETSDPHWRSEGELRLSWALFNEGLTSARKEWLMLSAKMLSLENFTGEVVDVDWVSDLANEKILQAKEEFERAKSSGADISEAENSLNFAVKSFDVDMKFAALYNALDSIAWSRASEVSSYTALSDISNYSTKEFNDEFSEAYRRHALYLASNHEIKGAAFSLYRAQLRDTVFEKGKFTVPKFEIPSFNFQWILIFLLSYWIFSGRSNKKKPTKMSQTEMMLLSESKARAVELLQEKLKSGEITDKTYYKLLRELGG
ncbi:MAG: hypothetical protein GOV01_01955 [Candidatus Altiarchaeota archaeon]|nr:hypothetical protein [Candidatus Altiarchaeota archaeon]